VSFVEDTEPIGLGLSNPSVLHSSFQYILV
jgi:hypothetical protein